MEWRNINNKILRKLIEGTDKIIIIPMTITNLDYYQEIITGLDSKIIRQFLLLANDNTLIETRIDTNVMNLDSIVEIIIERIK